MQDLVDRSAGAWWPSIAGVRGLVVVARAGEEEKALDGDAAPGRSVTRAADAGLFPAGWQARAITWVIVRVLLVALGLWLSP